MTRTPNPNDSSCSSVSTCPFFTAMCCVIRSTTRMSAYDAPRTWAILSARPVMSFIVPPLALKRSNDRTFLRDPLFEPRIVYDRADVRPLPDLLFVIPGFHFERQTPSVNRG